MNKYLFIAVLFFSVCSAYAQVEAPINNIGIGVGTTDPNPGVFKFYYQNKLIGHYALGWYIDQNFTGAPTAYLAGYGGLKFFTGGQPRFFMDVNGNVGISTIDPGNYKLNVWGRVRAHEVVVNTTGADFVFEDNYHLRPLKELEQFIQQHKHLPEIASADDMQKEGVGISELQTKLLQKVEELTLYMIEQHKKSESQDKKIETLEQGNAALKAAINHKQKQ